MSNIDDLPYPDDNFIGAHAKMDLSELRDKQFVVAINTGDPANANFICRSMRGPYTLAEMAEAVGRMWQDEMHHAHVTVLQKDQKIKANWISPDVVDYIEQHFEDIIMDEFLGNFTGEFTCRAKILDQDPEDKEDEQPQSEAQPASDEP